MYFFLVLRIKPRALGMLSKHTITSYISSPINIFWYGFTDFYFIQCILIHHYYLFWCWYCLRFDQGTYLWDDFYTQIFFASKFSLKGKKSTPKHRAPEVLDIPLYLQRNKRLPLFAFFNSRKLLNCQIQKCSRTCQENNYTDDSKLSDEK
jgi:hypothetical protein